MIRWEMSKIWRALNFIGGLTLVSILYTSCGERGTDSVEPTFSSLYANYFSSACVQCHSPGTDAYDDGVLFDFTTQESAYDSLLSRTVTSPSNPGLCLGVKIVDAGNAKNSYLTGVLLGSYNTNNFAGVSGCRPDQGHINRNDFPSSAQSALLNWINEGAQNN